MRKKERIQVEPQREEEKVLDVNATMQGSLRFDDPVNLRINGKFEGTLDTKGQLTVGERAEIKANITGESIAINGNVAGNIKASKVLSLGRSARLDGDVEAPAFSVQEGAVVNGQIRMETYGATGSQNRSGRMDADQLAKYLEVDKDKISEWAQSGRLPGSRENGEWLFDKNKVDEWVAQGSTRV